MHRSLASQPSSLIERATEVSKSSTDRWDHDIAMRRSNATLFKPSSPGSQNRACRPNQSQILELAQNNAPHHPHRFNESKVPPSPLSQAFEFEILAEVELFGTHHLRTGHSHVTNPTSQMGRNQPSPPSPSIYSIESAI
jgi:hypothetical protein